MDTGERPGDIDELSQWVQAGLVVDTATLAPAVGSLRECVLAWEGYRLQLATFLGVTTNDSTALSYLVSRGAMPINELGSLLGFSSGSVTLLIDRLEAKGLVQRSADPTDRRRTIVAASSASHGQLAQMARWPSVVFAGLAADEVAEVARVLDLVGARLRGFAELVAAAEAPVDPPRRRQ